MPNSRPSGITDIKPTATAARRTANATFLKPRATDEASRIIFGMDLTPLVADDTRDIADFVAGHIAVLAADVRRRLTGPRREN